MANKIDVKKDLAKMDDRITSCANRLNYLNSKHLLDEKVKNEAKDVYDVSMGVCLQILQEYDKNAAEKLAALSKEIF